MTEVNLEGETDRTWTYRELLADSEKLALALSTRFSPGERVTVWAPNIPEWLLMEYACALAGIVLVTANPAYQVKELRYVMELFAGAMPAAFRGDLYPRVEAVQEMLGNVNDHRWAVQQFQCWKTEFKEADTVAFLDRLVDAEQTRLETSQQEFFAWWSADKAQQLQFEFESYVGR